jgi:hypothetical protein
MRIGKIAVKRRVWIGLVFAVGVTGAWLVWTRSRPAVGAAPVAIRQPFVRLAGAGHGADVELLRERADLFDPTPLFFPTEWNYGQRALPESMRRQPGQVFVSFGANFTFDEQSIKNYGAEAVLVPDRLVDVLVQGNEKPFAGMGQIDVQRPPLVERSGFLEVKGLVDGKLILEQTLKSLSLPRMDFGPMEFLVVVSSSGIVGDPVLMSESGLEEVDEDVDTFFRSYLVKSFRLGERLSPGRYRVLVGP